MHKYIVQPSYMIDKNGYKHSVEDLQCDGEHSSGTSTGASNCECDNKRYKITCYGVNGEYVSKLSSDAEKTLDETISQLDKNIQNTVITYNRHYNYLSNVAGQVDEYTGYVADMNDDIYKLQQNDKKQDTNIESAKTIANEAKTVANEAKTTANAAHSIASGLQTAVGNAESTAVKAQNKATEASNQISSISADYENLKSRIEDLEATDGQASEPIVGNSKMGYDSDFTDFGLNGKYYVQATWKEESRALQFGKEDNIGDVLEDLIYTTASGLTSHNERITALENGSGGNTSGGTSSGTTHTDCLEQNITYKPAGQMSKEALELLTGTSITDEQYQEFKNQTTTQSAKDLLEDTGEILGAVFAELQLNKNKITALEQGGSGGSVDLTQINNTLAGHTSSIQSLDTRTGSHTASIGQLENRMTDVELQSTTNKNNLNSWALRIDALENGVVSGSDPISVYEIKTANDMYGNLVYMDVMPSVYYAVNSAISQVNSNTYENYKMIDHYVNLIQTNVKNKLTSLKNAMVSDLNYIWSTLREKYPDLPQIGVPGASATDWNVSGVNI